MEEPFSTLSGTWVPWKGDRRLQTAGECLNGLFYPLKELCIIAMSNSHASLTTTRIEATCYMAVSGHFYHEVGVDVSGGEIGG